MGGILRSRPHQTNNYELRGIMFQYESQRKEEGAFTFLGF